MDLLLNNILNLTTEEIKNSKIEFNMHVGGSGEPFLDRWLKCNEVDKMAGTCAECSYWGWYGNQHNFFSGQWVFSFARITDDEWLFISAAEVLDVPANTWTITKVLKKFTPFFGRVIIKCKKGNTFSRYTFNLNRYLEQAVVKEILPCLYNGEKFEGYDKVHLPYHRLSDIFNGKILPTYHDALKKVTGVYCLTDTHTGKLYIGSATGTEGVAQRWGNYLDSKHGGNKKLISLYSQKGSEYFEKYFTFTLLEYFGLSYDPQKIVEREQYWKRCFDTIKNGYNDN
ncbi:MAG: GIY-YIG nuclease family protein [Lachnospiraceae bacterium]|nr:GIY-YIG nuclease family protein [Lachnospiraceae bacterium]